MEAKDPYYKSDDNEDEEFDSEMIDVELEDDDFKTQGKERCKNKFLNISCNDEDIESDPEDDNVDEAEDAEEFGSEEEIDDGEAAKTTNLDFEYNEVLVFHKTVQEMMAEAVDGRAQEQGADGGAVAEAAEVVGQEEGGQEHGGQEQGVQQRKLKPRRPSESILKLKASKPWEGVGKDEDIPMDLD